MKRRFLTTVIAAIVTLGLTGVANATIHPTDESPVGATAIANAVKTPSFNMLAALFQTAPPLNDPNGWADAPLNVFPTNGSTFGILTSGQVTLADDPNNSGSSGTADGGVSQGRGPTAYDVSVLQIEFEVPAGANCLTFDFKFFSEEYPEYVGTQFNDAFIAELDASTWTTLGPPTNDILAPGNFAYDGAPGNPVTVNTAGFSVGNAAGTTYDGATVLLSASTQVTLGPHTLYLSILDQGDQVLDSAVFLDNLRVGFVPNPAVNCQPGAQPVNYQMTLEPQEDTNPVGTPHTVTATLTDENDDPVVGALIQFQVTGANPHGPVPALTDANGQAQHTYVGANAGDDSITACYDADGDAAFEVCASAIKHWVAPVPTTLTLSPKTATNPVDTQHCVTATVRDQFGNPMPGVTVVFDVSGASEGDPPDDEDGTVTTNDDGEATFCYTGPDFPGADAIHAFADADGDNMQDPGEPFDDATKTWVLPVTTPGCEVKITNGGWIIAMNGDKSSFGGNAKADADGNVSGNEEYQDHGPAQPMNLHGNVLVVVCDSDTSATIYGEATIDGAGSFLYRLRVEDNGDGGKGIDKYWIIVDNGYNSGNQTLRGGNVQIHNTA